MKNTRTWLRSAVRAHRALRDLQLQQTHDAQRALDVSTAQWTSAQEQLADLSQAWVAHRESVPGEVQLEQTYLLFHAHLHELATLASKQQREASAQLSRMQGKLQQSTGKHRMLERLQETSHQQGIAHQVRQDLRTTSEDWLLGYYAKELMK